MKGTVYGNSLPRVTEVKKGWEPLYWNVLFLQVGTYVN